MKRCLPPPAAIPAGRLESLGFRRSGDGGDLRLNGMVLLRQGSWAALESVHPLRGADPLECQLGKVGLWRCVECAGGRSVRRVFDLPPSILAGGSQRGGAPALASFEANAAEGSDLLPSVVEWAMESFEERIPAGWRPPEQDEVEARIPSGALTVQRGRFVRQGSLIWSPSRLGLSFAVLPAVPPDLPAPRRALLYRLLIEAQSQWRLVRLGLTGAPADAAVLAEVDLTGAPPAALEALLETAIAALRWVVDWIGPTVELVADAKAPSQVVNIIATRATPAERSSSHE